MFKPSIDLSTREQEQLYIIDRVDIDLETGCWLWKQRCTHGYGVIGPGHRLCKKYANTKVSRLSYILFVGSIADGLVVRHKCRSRRCCNPDHLELGTQTENNLDKLRDGTTTNGSKNGASKLTEDVVGNIRALYATGKVTQKALALKYNVSETCIRRIVRNLGWHHVS